MVIKLKKEEKLDIKKIIFSIISAPFVIALPFLKIGFLVWAIYTGNFLNYILLLIALSFILFIILIPIFKPLSQENGKLCFSILTIISIFSFIICDRYITGTFLIITRLNICYIYLYLIFKFYYSEEKDEPAIISNANSENLKKDMENKIETEKINNNDINETLKTIKNIGENVKSTDNKETIIDENKT